MAATKLQEICPRCEKVVDTHRFRDAIATCADDACVTTVHRCTVCSAVNQSYARYCRACPRELDPFHDKLERWGKGAGAGLEGLGFQTTVRYYPVGERLSSTARLVFVGGQIWLLDGLVTAPPGQGTPDPFADDVPEQKPVVRYFGEESDEDFTRFRDVLPSLQLAPDERLFGSPVVVGHDLLLSTGRRLLAWPLSNLGRQGSQLLAPAVWTPPDGRRVVGDPLALSKDEVVVATADEGQTLVCLHMLRLEGEKHRRQVVQRPGDCRVEGCDPRRIYLSQGDGREVYLASTYKIFRYEINAGQLMPRTVISLSEMRPAGPVFCSFHSLFFDAVVPNRRDPEGDWIWAVGSGFLQDGQPAQVSIYPGSEDILRSYWNSGTGGQKLFLVGVYDLRLYQKLRHDAPKVRQQSSQARACSQLGPLVAVARGGGLTEDRHSVELINFQHSVDPLGNIVHAPLDGTIRSPGALCLTPDRLFAILDRGEFTERYELAEIPFDLNGNRA